MMLVCSTEQIQCLESMCMCLCACVCVWWIFFFCTMALVSMKPFDNYYIKPTYTHEHTHRHTLNKRNSKKIAKGVIIVCYWFTRWKFVDCLFFFSLFFLLFESVFITWYYLSFQFDSVWFSLIQFQIKFNWSISTR